MCCRVFKFLADARDVRKTDLRYDPMRNERRQNPRIKPEELIYLKLGSENGGIILDLCERGLCFRTVSPVELGEPLSFSLSLAPANRLQATGELAWTDSTRKTGGLQFTWLPSNARQQLQSWLDQHGLPMPEIAEAEATSPMNEKAWQETASEVIPPPKFADFMLPAKERIRVTSPAAHAAGSSQQSQAEATHAEDRTRDTPTRTNLIDLRVSASHNARTPFGFARTAIVKFKALFSSVAASEDVQNAPEDLLITGVDFTLIGTNACIAFFRSLATPGVIREAAKVAFFVSSIVFVIIVVLSFHGDLGNSLIRLGRDIAGDQQAAPMVPSSSSPASSPASSSAPGFPASVPSRANKFPTAPVRNGVSRRSLRVPGDSQLDIARQYLRGVNGTHQPEKAVPWLWAASHEGNVAADILLGELYIRGEGVPQNCQQGIVLLTAAAKKGDPVAEGKLRDVDAGPCGNGAKPN